MEGDLERKKKKQQKRDKAAKPQCQSADDGFRCSSYKDCSPSPVPNQSRG